MKKPTKNQQKQIAAVTAKRDAEIDFSGMPEVIDWSHAEIGKFYRPEKKSVTIRLDADVVEWLKGYGPGYQTRVNLLLRHAMQNTREGSGRRSRRTA